MLKKLFFILATLSVIIIFALSVMLGNGISSPAKVYATFAGMTAHDFEQATILYQRFPRVLIALYVGAVMAYSGLVFQGLIQNPLSSSSTLGVNAGATLFVVGGAILFNFSLAAQGILALLGGIFGFLSCLFVARLAGLNGAPRGLLLILAGTLITMLYLGGANAILLANPSQRTDFLAWIAGNINHVYIDRFYKFCWLGGVAFVILLSLSKPLTLGLLGKEKATSMGVNAIWVSRIAMATAIVASSSAVAICGPISFVGLVVPHMVRPLVGQNFAVGLTASALVGASVCALADLCARVAFQPYVINTGVLLDLMGGLVFIFMIRKFYISSSVTRLL